MGQREAATAAELEVSTGSGPGSASWAVRQDTFNVAVRAMAAKLIIRQIGAIFPAMRFMVNLSI